MYPVTMTNNEGVQTGAALIYYDDSRSTPAPNAAHLPIIPCFRPVPCIIHYDTSS